MPLLSVKPMDPAERRYMEEEDTPLMKTIKGGTTGLVAGTIWGMIVASWHDVPRVERNVALPGLLRTLRMMGNYGMTFAAVGGVYIGVEQLVQHYRMKRDFVNGAIGGFVAGATILGYKGGNFFNKSAPCLHYLHSCHHFLVSMKCSNARCCRIFLIKSYLRELIKS